MGGGSVLGGCLPRLGIVNGAVIMQTNNILVFLQSVFINLCPSECTVDSGAIKPGIIKGLLIFSERLFTKRSDTRCDEELFPSTDSV